MGGEGEMICGDLCSQDWLVIVETILWTMLKCTVDLKSITAQANKNATVEVLARSSLIKIKPREQFCFADEIAHVLLSYGVILVEMLPL